MLQPQHRHKHALRSLLLLPLLVSHPHPLHMQVLAGMLEDELPTAVAPFATQAGPVIDGRAMDRALNTLYRECTASARAAKAAAASNKTAAAAAAADKAAAAAGGVGSAGGGRVAEEGSDSS
jgi:hypothetical protein